MKKISGIFFRDLACIDLMNTLALQEMLQGLLHCNDGNHRIRLPNKLNIKVFKFQHKLLTINLSKDKNTF